jgi:adenine-specific DNA glycosylase
VPSEFDAECRRNLTRIFGVKEDTKEKRHTLQLWQVAEALVTTAKRWDQSCPAINQAARMSAP